MAEYFNTWDDGEKKWIKKMGRKYYDRELDMNTSDVLHVNLMSCDIKTDIVDESWVVKHAGIEYKHYENKDITYWELRGNIITLYFVEGEPYKLLFFTPGEAIKADFRLFLIMNGLSIIGCEDAEAYVCGNILNLAVDFDMG